MSEHSLVFKFLENVSANCFVQNRDSYQREINIFRSLKSLSTTSNVYMQKYVSYT